MSNHWTTGTLTFPCPNTAGDIYTVPIPEQPNWKQPTITWPPPVEPHPAELESFEEFVIWACGFTDPDNPPSQKKWEEFQEKVRRLAADFVEYKRWKRERERMTSQPSVTYASSSTTGL